MHKILKVLPSFQLISETLTKDHDASPSSPVPTTSGFSGAELLPLTPPNRLLLVGLVPTQKATFSGKPSSTSLDTRTPRSTSSRMLCPLSNPVPHL